MNTIITIALCVGGFFFLMKLPFFIKLLPLLVKDAYHFIKDPRKPHLYGIWLICGLYGQGKTMALSEYLFRMREKYGDSIYISTNYGFALEDFPLTSWEDLLTTYDKPVIFGYDEIQNEFNSRDYRNFPYELVKLLTQNRKGNGKQIIGTAQRYGRVDKTIRELCTHVIECRRAWFGRVTKLRKYDVEDYEQMLNEIDVIRKRKVPCSRYSFIQTDELRGLYDTLQMLETAKTKEYVSAGEKLAMKLAEEMTDR